MFRLYIVTLSKTEQEKEICINIKFQLNFGWRLVINCDYKN